MMHIDPGLVPLMFAAIAALAVCAIPLAACILFALTLLLWLNPAPLPQGFLLNYSLAIRLNSPALISIPLFALAGELAVAAGISERLLDLADCLAGRGRHAAGARTIAGCALFASVSAVGPAAVTAEGKRLVPDMLKAGYSRPAAAGAIACAAALAIVIPASVPLTVYAAAAGIPTNIVFTASFLPGLILAAGLLIAMITQSRRRKWRSQPPAGRQPLAAALRRAAWSLLMPVLVLTSLFTGFLTAPEAAAFSCLYAVLVGRIAHRDMPLAEIRAALDRASAVAAAILLMAGMGGLLAMLMNACGFTDSMAGFIHAACGGTIGSILFMNVLLLLLGCVLDMTALITVVAPLLLPLAARCGLSPAHFGVVVVLNIAVGLVTPPQAWNAAAAGQVAGIGVWSVARGALPFVAVMLAVLALASYVPAVSLWLPGVFGWPTG